MAFIWSGGADFFQTTPSAGNPSLYQFNVLTIPPNTLIYPGTGAMLIVSLVSLVTPGPPSSYTNSFNGLNQMCWGFQDMNGDVWLGGFSATLVGTTTLGTSIETSNQNALYDRSINSMLQYGGVIRLFGFFSTSPTSMTINGTIVAAIWDSALVTANVASSSSGNTLAPVTGNSFFADLGAQFYDGGWAICQGRRNGGIAPLPNFANSPNWTNVVRRTNGGELFAGIGYYAGPSSSSVPFRIEATNTGGIPNLWHWSTVRSYHTAATPPVSSHDLMGAIGPMGVVSGSAGPPVARTGSSPQVLG